MVPTHIHRERERGGVGEREIAWENERGREKSYILWLISGKGYISKYIYNIYILAKKGSGNSVGSFNLTDFMPCST